MAEGVGLCVAVLPVFVKLLSQGHNEQVGWDLALDARVDSFCTLGTVHPQCQDVPSASCSPFVLAFF